MAPVTLHRPLNEQRYIVRACVHSPYAFLLAKNRSDLGVSEGDQPWDFFGGNDAKAETPILWSPHAKS